MTTQHKELKEMVMLGKELSREWVEDGRDLQDDLIMPLVSGEIAPKLSDEDRNALCFLAALGLRLITESMRADLGIGEGESPR